MEADGYRRPGGAARRRARRARSRSTTTSEIEGLRALDRYTLRFKLGRAAPALRRDAGRRRPVTARSRARWSSSTASRSTRIRSAPGRSGSPSGGAARCIVLERNPDFREMLYDAEPAADDAEGQALLARFKGRRLPMIDRVEIAIIEEDAAALAVVRQRRGRFRRTRAATSSSTQAMPERQGRAQPGQARHPRLSDQSSRRRVLRASTWTTRWSAATRRPTWRCAARSGWASTPTREIRHAAQRPGDRGAVADRAVHHRLRPGLRRRDAASTTRRARKGAARPVRLPRPRRRRLARAARRLAAAARDRDADRPGRSAQLDELCKKNMDAIGIRIAFKSRSGRRT